MQWAFTASRSPEVGGRCHTEPPECSAGHNESTMKRVQSPQPSGRQILWANFLAAYGRKAGRDKGELEGNVPKVLLLELGCLDAPQGLQARRTITNAGTELWGHNMETRGRNAAKTPEENSHICLPLSALNKVGDPQQSRCCSGKIQIDINAFSDAFIFWCERQNV